MSPRITRGLVTIDVEPDDVWADTHSVGLTNLDRLPLFHEVCVRYDVRPTYLLTWSVVKSDRGSAIVHDLLASGCCEVGIHPHLWETPPFVPLDAERCGSMGNQYDQGTLDEKIGNLVNAVTERFGAPKSHRAGRFGFDSRQVGILLKQGIEVDTSVTPGLDWSASGGPNFSAAPLGAHFLSAPAGTGTGARLLEVPCTIRPGVRFMGIERTAAGRKVRERAGLGEKWFRCHPAREEAFFEQLHAWACARSLPLNLMSHSSEFAAGCSPYWRDEAAVARHLDLCSKIFESWKNRQIRSVTLSEFAADVTSLPSTVSAKA